MIEEETPLSNKHQKLDKFTMPTALWKNMGQ